MPYAPPLNFFSQATEREVGEEINKQQLSLTTNYYHLLLITITYYYYCYYYYY